MKYEIELPDWQGTPQGAAQSKADRAGYARPVVEAYRDHFAPGDPLGTAIIDLMADLLHLNDMLDLTEGHLDEESRLDYVEVLERAKNHYEYEMDELCPICGQPDNCGDCTHDQGD